MDTRGDHVGVGPTVTLTLGLAFYTFTLTVTDTTGQFATDTTAVTVQLPTLPGPAGPQGPPGEGLVAGALLLLPAGSPAPTNYRFVGTFILTGAPPKAEKMHVDVYRHN
ncbi:MAG: hypothetical protein DMF89_13425 [Acidobacteria bacterium]|nr:MAG: hypothetical protein DMF89_13425 [Acidobacteriota bacterium]